MASTNDLVRAAGLLIYRRNTKITPPAIEYLLLQASYEPFHWTPPKGHVDPGEDEWAAAIREVKEEAGIDTTSQLKVHKKFKYEMFYSANSKPKRVTYWLAEALDNDLGIALSHEHKDWKWVELVKAIELSKFEEMKKLLDASHSFLKTEEN